MFSRMPKTVGGPVEDHDSLTALPALDEAELRAIFRDDERAAWRYRILAAMLHRGQTPNEVAERFGTTPETVRSLRAAFAETGSLDSLRSKRRGAAGHLGRQTPLAQAVARELAAAPDASANEIWRRVHERLDSRGVAVPRRTIYRLVERLRPQAGEQQPAGDELWPPALVPALRQALPLLPIEPPIDLGRSALAERLLPKESDPATRGRMVAGLLKAALDSIGPAAVDDPRDVSFRPHRILIGELLEGQTREELQLELAIATATYTRAKRNGLERIAELVVREIRTRQRARHALPPTPAALFGRDQQVANYSRRLHNEGIALIWGLPCSGKSALGAALAANERAAGVEVTWHVCGGSGESIVAQLLASCGSSAPAGAGVPELIAQARSCFRQGGLLVLENYERIARDPISSMLLAAIRASIEPHGLRLIVIGRELPEWAEDGGWLPLGGLPDELLSPLWACFGGTPLEPEAWPAVARRTLGYPGLLQHLASRPDVALEELLLDETTQGLSPDARTLLVDLLLGGTADEPAEPAQPADGLALVPVRELQLRGLVTRGGDATQPYLHPLLVANRASLLGLLDVQDAHTRLAQRAMAQGEWLFAARQLFAAGAVVEALATLAQHAETLAAQKDGQQAIELVQSLVLRLAPSLDLARANGLLGELWYLLGDDRNAIGALRTALELGRLFVAELPPGSLRRWQRLTAESFVRLGDWRQALAYAQASMGSEQRIGADVEADERLALTLVQHRIWLLAGETNRARFWLADAQMLLQIAPSPLGQGLVALAEGLQLAQHGSHKQAALRLHTALELLPQQLCWNERFTAGAGLARAHTELGEYAAARTVLDHLTPEAGAREHRAGFVELCLARAELALALESAAETHSALASARAWHDELNRRLGAKLELVAGRLAMLDRPHDTAYDHLVAVLDLASDPVLDELRAAANIQLALWCLQRGDPTTAVQHAATAKRLAEAAELARFGALASLCLAQEAVLRRASDEADLVLTAIDTADDPLLRVERGRLQAELLYMRGDAGAANAYSESMAALRLGPSLHRRWAEQRYAAFLRSSGSQL